jgi:hypothetical protein
MASVGVLLIVISITTMVDVFTSAKALAQSTRQDTVCSDNTCTTTTCVNGQCKTTNSGSADNFALNLCINNACNALTRP